MSRLTLAAVALAATLATPAAAQSVDCLPHAEMIEGLSRSFNEHRIGLGLDARGSVMEIYISAETGSWSLVATRPNGMSCIVGAGHGWENIAPLIPGAPEQAS